DTGCLTKLGATTYQAVNSEVHIDGLVLTPRDRDSNGNAVLTVDTAAKTIKSEGIGVTYSITLQGHPNVPIFYGKIDWSFKDDYTGPVPLDQNPTGKPKELKGMGAGANGFGFIEGLPITGIQAVFTTKDTAVVTPTFKLDFFPLNYFGAISVSGSFTTETTTAPTSRASSSRSRTPTCSASSSRTSTSSTPARGRSRAARRSS